MDTALLITWVALPVLGGAIGYVTNRIAVKMIFRPIRPVNILGIRVQGLIGRRQKELAKSIGSVVGDHLVRHEDVVRSFDNVDLDSLVGEIIDQGLAPKIDELRSLPLIGGFLTQERIDELRNAVARGITDNRDAVFGRLEAAIAEGLDVTQVVEEKVASFAVETLETLVLRIASRELRAIEILGGVLGAFIGLAQAALVWGFS